MRRRRPEARGCRKVSTRCAIIAPEQSAPRKALTRVNKLSAVKGNCLDERSRWEGVLLSKCAVGGETVSRRWNARRRSICYNRNCMLRVYVAKLTADENVTGVDWRVPGSQITPASHTQSLCSACAGNSSKSGTAVCFGKRLTRRKRTFGGRSRVPAVGEAAGRSEAATV